jgi:uncharacterized protein (TIGR04222 family)
VLDLYGPDFLKLYICLLVVFATLHVVAALWRRLQDHSTDLGGVPELDLADLAYLCGGPRRVVGLSLLNLLKSGRLRLDVRGRVEKADIQAGDSPLERGLLHEAKLRRRLPSLGGGRLLRETGRQRQELVKLGLIHPASRIRQERWVLRAIGLALALLGVAKVMVGLSRDRPVGLLVLLLVGFAIAACVSWAKARHQPVLTRLGADTVKQYRLGRSAPHGHKAQKNSSLAKEFAVLGATALVGTAWAQLPPFEIRSASSSSGGDGGRSCSGGSSCGGSSCGGCGSS